jgi:glycosyltransferase involved in cell wall biosynthesis
MIIGFDAKRAFYNTTGLGNYSRTLIEELAIYFPENEYHLFTPKKSNLFPFENLPAQQFHVHENTSIWPDVYWRSRLMAGAASQHNVQLFHGLSHELPAGLGPRGIKSVVTMHDTLFMDFPRDFKPVDRAIYKKKWARACQQADIVVAISEATKARLQHYFNLPDERVKVIYQSVNETFANPPDQQEIINTRFKYLLPENYLLFVSSIIPRKNLKNVLEALHIMKDPPPLVVIGKGGKKRKRLQRMAVKYGLQVLWPEVDSIKELQAIYHSASAFIYPSLGEGFGIPIIEAQMSGIPVLTSNISVMPEVAGEAALYFDPLSVESIAESIETIFCDASLVKSLIQTGKLNVSRFSGKACAEGMNEIYVSLL